MANEQYDAESTEIIESSEDAVCSEEPMPILFSAIQHDDSEKKPAVKIVPQGKKYRISIFFDGTLNNMENVILRKKNKKYFQDKKDNFFNFSGSGDLVNWKGPGRGYDSYFSEFSNVAKMFRYLNTDVEKTDYEKHEKFYIDGIATKRGQPDEKYIGAGMGMGINGIDAKVQYAFRYLGRLVVDYKAPLIDLLSVDVFGFSRGAAAARYFVHKLLMENKLRKLLDANKDKIKKENKPKPQIKKIEVRFAGLFDTVASHGISHGNDTKDLGLDSICNAKKVVHLTAADEYRDNFSLTNIASAVSNQRGIEISLPGAHSDVGGGYVEVEKEEEMQVLDEDHELKGIANRRILNDEIWLKEQGWYTASEIIKKKTWLDAMTDSEGNFWDELKVNRFGIKNTYSRIPLRIMVHYARQAGLNYSESKLNNDEPLEDPATVTPVNKSMLTQENWEKALTLSFPGNEIEWFEKASFEKIHEILKKDGTGYWKGWDTTKYLKLVRHRYFHFSACYGDIGMQPRRKDTDDWTPKRVRREYRG